MISDSRLYKLIKKIPACADATNIEPLHGGLTNSNYRVDVHNKSYVVRVSDHSSSLLGIDRENEKINTERAWRAGVGAELIDFLPAQNILVIGWIEAKTLHAEDIHAEVELLPALREEYGKSDDARIAVR